MNTFRVNFPFFLVWGTFIIFLVCMVIAVWAEKSSSKRIGKLARIQMMYAERGEAPQQSIIDGLAIAGIPAVPSPCAQAADGVRGVDPARAAESLVGAEVMSSEWPHEVLVTLGAGGDLGR